MKFLKMAIVLLFFFSFSQQAFAAPSFQQIGAQVKNLNVSAAASGSNKKGEPLMYSVLQGMPAQLAVTNLATGKLTDVKALGGTTAGWSVEVADSSNVYIGTTPGELLYHYDPDGRKLTKLGKPTVKNSTVIWDLAYAAQSRTLYGVSSNEGRLFQYGGKSFKDLGTVISGKKDARSIAYDPAGNQLFIGLGSPAELAVYDIKNGKKTAILPGAYRGQKHIEDIKVINGTVFVKLNPANKILTFDAKTKKLLGEFSATSKGVSPLTPGGNSVYYGNGSSLFEYDLTTGKSLLAVNNRIPTSLVSLDFVNIKGDFTLVGKVGNVQRYMTYHPHSKEYQNLDLTLPMQPIEMHKIGGGTDGKIYSSGFLNGSMGIYDPGTKMTVHGSSIGQLESMASLGGKIYFGTYPKSRILEYNPKESWHPGTNPREVFSLESVGQDRPMAALAVPGTNKLVFGTAPVSGKSGGALAVYDPSSKKMLSRHGIVKDHSIVSLAYSAKGKLVYGGTSIFGKPNVDKTKTKAVLFSLPAGNLSAKPQHIALPYKHVRFISALTAADDGKVWGMADGRVFYLQPGKGVTDVGSVVPDVAGHTPQASLVTGRDGNIYGCVEKTLFKVDKKSYKITILRKNDVHQLIQSSSGDLYYHDKKVLWKINL
ncbi:hypothetical protein GJU40_16100 [Bacillus lacus]|uniref:WD40 repeat domain-containing protein n=1 Tax=Metabacillus lacus TaxID=1983721 RepID=A0A7X2J1K4_9BACI|nr:hypothetical protein [Metabacillus lacus]MRX73665.1 hypothetical protein [Metabacillus lacus]